MIIATLRCRVSFLLALKLSAGKGPSIVLCQRFSVPLELIRRGFRCSDRKLARVISRIFGIDIQIAQDGDTIEDYGAHYLDTMQRSTEVALAIEPELRREEIVRTYAAVLGETAAVAFFLKLIAGRVFGYLLLMRVAELQYPHRTIRFYEPGLPSYLRGALSKHFSSPHSQFHEPIHFICGHLCATLAAMFRKWVIFSWLIATRGITFRRDKEKIPYAFELIDHRNLQGRAVDADFFVDDQQIQSGNVAAFLPMSQENRLRRLGVNVRHVRLACEQRGYRLIRCKRVKIGGPEARILFALVFASRKQLSPKWVTSMDAAAFREIAELLPLFGAFQFERVITTSIPNGATGLRYNDGIVTGLCRRFGAQSIGYQTRVVYSSKFEYYFDCYDVYLSWGRGWYEPYPNRDKFIGRLSHVGCLLSPAASQPKDHHQEAFVTIFPTDADNRGTHYTVPMLHQFLRQCAELALHNPAVRFRIKFKDPEQVLLLDERERALFQICPLQRYDCQSAINDSRAVIAMAYTTPGFEALVSGVPAIFLRQNDLAGEALKCVPHLVPANFDELLVALKSCLTNPNDHLEAQRPFIETLDHATDGFALLRARQQLASRLIA